MRYKELLEQAGNCKIKRKKTEKKTLITRLRIDSGVETTPCRFARSILVPSTAVTHLSLLVGCRRRVSNASSQSMLWCPICAPLLASSSAAAHSVCSLQQQHSERYRRALNKNGILCDFYSGLSKKRCFI